MLCDMCGSEGKLYKTIVEGAELTLCDKCSKFGKVMGVVKQQEEVKKEKKLLFEKVKEPEQEVMEIITENYAEKIRKKRESLDLTQKEFAKKINEKESLIQKIETGNFEPSISLAKKIERFLNIKLIEEHEEIHEKPQHAKTGTFTIGDFIKARKK